jgi:hypothetical protein
MKSSNDFGFDGVVFRLTQFRLHEIFPFLKTKETIMVCVELAKRCFDFVDLLLRECLFKFVN